MKEIDVSVILTFHNEGAVIYKTFLSLERMLKKLDEKKVRYEIIAHLDNGDEKTRRYIERAKERLNIKLFENHFGEPSQSRNFAVTKSKGRYVCLMDGDDLFSERWLIDAYMMQEATTEDVILHPECNLTFGLDEQPRLWRMKDSFSLDEDTLILFGRNRWCSGTFLKRGVAKKYPYEKAIGCYGFEDWHFNCETRANDIKHNVVPGSVLFYRVRKDSTYSRHTGQNTTIPYTSAFELGKMKKLYSTKFEESPIVIPDANKKLRILRFGHKVLRRTPVINMLDGRITETIERRRSEQRIKELPPFLIKEWKAINRIDSELYPDKEIVSRMPIYDSELDYLGKIYCRLVHTLKREPDYIFMPPIMSVGGTEKVLENYWKVIYQLHPEWYVLVFGKLPDGHPYKIPPNVTFVDFDYITKDLSDWDRGFVLTKFIVQMKTKRLHIIGNEFYYRWAMSNSELLKTNKIILNCSFFMHEYNKDEKRIQSFADSYLLGLEPSINKVFTDNAVIADDLVNRTGFDKAKVSVHYQPVELKTRIPKKSSDKKVHRILWASRVAPQKRPDILKRIAAKLPDNYIIHVYGRIQKPYFSDDYFNGARGIVYKGAFSGVDKIPVEDYDAYLYTSQTDGIPNVLLEITALGLPIVATREGGVSDFLSEESGKLVEMDDIDGYIKALCDVVESNTGEKYARKAQKKLKIRHSWAEYKKSVDADLK